MAQGYESSGVVSTGVVPAMRWRLALAGFAALCAGGAAFALALALGLADLHPAGPLTWETDDPVSWELLEDSGETRLYRAPIVPPTPPFTLELCATLSDAAGSAWGMWLETSEGRQITLISGDGYFSASRDERPHWREFIHLRPTENSLWLDVRANGAATLYINKEYAWQGILAQDGREWGWAAYGEAQVDWGAIRLYASDAGG